MGTIDSLRGSVVGFDTMPLIYYIEEHPTYLKVVEPFFRAIEHGEFEVVTSVITLLEVLVHPIRNGDIELAQEYRTLLFDTEGLSTNIINREIAEEASRLRALYKIRTPDSIQLATAILGGASYFLTNDVHFQSLPDIKILLLDNLKKEIESEQQSQEP
ncbi:MAG TPA: PIN domain-containing protein [Ktedonobacteraceae bacterium]|jgi:predicted nucleic acid-binding protein|nr:PIN domain-containing protein [Ktedonobacteraceae bacterium]